MPTLDFKGKPIIYAHHLTVPSRALELDAKKSLPPKGRKPSLDDNLIIHGDNLHALKALMPRYAGRVNCIYIDPPYNIGNEGWIYNDSVSSPMMKEWLKDKSPVDGEDLERHDKWLCMMWPRLQLLRELLAEDGVIFVSIDDNEQHRLRMMMDEIFGEENYRNIVVVRRGVKSVQRQFKKIDRLNFGCEYVLTYSKNADFKFEHLTELLEEMEGGGWNNHWRGTDRPTMRYEIFGLIPESGQWRWSRKRSMAAIDNYARMLREINKPESRISQDEIDDWYVAQDNPEIDLLRLSSNEKPEHYVPPSDAKYLSNLWSDLKPNGSNQVKKIFGGKVFENPKSTDLIRRLVRFACSESKNAIVLDSFAGSGTTAQAVLELNKHDNGNRNFILVECENYADKITAERVRRVIRGIPRSKDESLKKGLGGSFTWCTLGDELSIENMLTGRKLPDYETLARHIFRTATGQSPDTIRKARGEDGLFHETKDRLFYLIYEPETAFLRSNKSALNSERAVRIAKQAKAKKKTAVVFATHKFMGQKELGQMGITFAQLPYCMNSGG
ncbi:MAG: site-specific DNA-methyltransferase [Nitrospira sp.]|nr:site-specific DNA-methyltransferase [Nitrospira sp.]